MYNKMAPNEKLEYLASHSSVLLPPNARMSDIQRANSEDIIRVQNKLSIIAYPLFNSSSNSQFLDHSGDHPQSHHHHRLSRPPTPPVASSASPSPSLSLSLSPSPSPSPLTPQSTSFSSQQRYHSSGVNVAAALFGSPLTQFAALEKESNGGRRKPSSDKR